MFADIDGCSGDISVHGVKFTEVDAKRRCSAGVTLSFGSRWSCGPEIYSLFSLVERTFKPTMRSSQNNSLFHPEQALSIHTVDLLPAYLVNQGVTSLNIPLKPELLPDNYIHIYLTDRLMRGIKERRFNEMLHAPRHKHELTKAFPFYFFRVVS